MKTAILIALSLLLALSPVVYATESPTVEAVCKSPEKYEGKTVNFKDLLLSGTLTKGSVRYRLTVKTAVGNIIDTQFVKERITFVTSHQFGDSVLASLDPTKFYPVRLECKIIKAKDHGDWYWLARVLDVQFVGPPLPFPRQTAPLNDGSAGSYKREKKLEVILTPGKTKAMTPKQLLEHYDPSEADNPVGQRLVKISRGEPCIVFRKDNTVNVTASAVLIGEIRDSLPPRKLYVIEGTPHKLYRVGERPDMLLDENPLYPKSPLRADQVCDKTNRSWDKVPVPVRQVLYLAVTKTGEIKIISVDDAQNILDKLSDKTSDQCQEWVKERYAKSFVLYEELRRRSELPSLKVPHGVQPGPVDVTEDQD